MCLFVIGEYVEMDNFEFICKALESNTTITELDIKGNRRHSLFMFYLFVCIFKTIPSNTVQMT